MVPAIKPPISEYTKVTPRIKITLCAKVKPVTAEIINALPLATPIRYGSRNTNINAASNPAGTLLR